MNDEREIAEIAPIHVIGPFVRTANEYETSGPTSRIGPLWGAFLNGGADRIPGVEDALSIYSLYTNYASDHNGEYDVVLGRSVGEGQEAPEGMKKIEIPAGRYLLFPASGETPMEIWQAWKGVYEYFAESQTLKRAFSVDFEKHTAKGIVLYIAIGV